MSGDHQADRPVPVGERFSHVYVDRPQAGSDSQRMRRRLASLIGSIDDLGNLGERAEQELGIPATWSSQQTWYDCCGKWKRDDVLDLITIAYRHLVTKYRERRYGLDRSSQWLQEVNRIFQEENLHYRVDGNGGVHFDPDREFAHNAASCIASLQGSRYANTLSSFEAGRAALTGPHPDGKTSIRSTFSAIEGLFRLMFPAAPRLTSSEAQNLTPLLQLIYSAEPTATAVATKMLKSFQDWIEAAHFYRHEQGSEEVAQPPLSVAIYLVSTGASHLRWLAEIDLAAAVKDGPNQKER